MTDSPSALAGYISSDSGDVEAQSYTERIGMNYVKCQAFNENMETVIIEGTELKARAICHELDHLKGILYRDRAEGGLREVE